MCVISCLREWREYQRQRRRQRWNTCEPAWWLYCRFSLRFEGGSVADGRILRSTRWAPRGGSEGFPRAARRRLLFPNSTFAFRGFFRSRSLFSSLFFYFSGSSISTSSVDCLRRVLCRVYYAIPTDINNAEKERYNTIEEAPWKVGRFSQARRGYQLIIRRRRKKLYRYSTSQFLLSRTYRKTSLIHLDIPNSFLFSSLFLFFCG